MKTCRDGQKISFALRRCKVDIVRQVRRRGRVDGLGLGLRSIRVSASSSVVGTSEGAMTIRLAEAAATVSFWRAGRRWAARARARVVGGWRGVAGQQRSAAQRSACEAGAREGEGEERELARPLLRTAESSRYQKGDARQRRRPRSPVAWRGAKGLAGCCLRL